ncbi:regulator of volume decrease after cellular swelling-domain-containing protein [Mycena floridula]|nr:regulator of volume decrease after cellular swelling-domain-containing protein [Mycena floridula]
MLITTIPTFVTPEEHKILAASTPTSFTDIPPVLRHKEENVSVTLDPPLEGFSAQDCEKGTLYVIESVLVYMSTTGRGFQVEYPHITLHAVSRSDKAAPSIYCQLEDPVADMELSAAAAAENDDEGDISMRELIIIPPNESALEPIFESLSRCAALHPDEPSPSDSEDDDEAFLDPDLELNSQFETFDGTEEQELSEVGRVRSDFVNDSRFAPY